MGTLDSNWRWLHIKDDYVNCYDGNLWDDEFCPDNPTCTENCELEGVDSADWTGTYGVTETNNGHGITLKFVTHGEYSSNVGSRSYLLAPDEENYYMFYLPNMKFTTGEANAEGWAASDNDVNAGTGKYG